MKTYSLEFSFWKINVDPLKEKEINKVIWILSNTRHVQDICHVGFGELTFDELHDEQHWHPIVEEQMTFNRRRSNCAIFDIHVTRGTNFYDKLFLYHSNNKRNGNWGYVLYNSNTKKSKHVYFIYDDLNDLISHINKSLNRMMRNDDFSLKHYESRGYIEPNVKFDSTNWLTGHLNANDWCRLDMKELPKIFMDKKVYRNNKRFIEM